MDHEVAKRLSALEFKLAELEHELALIGRRRQPSGESNHRRTGETADKTSTRERAIDQGQPVEQERLVTREQPVEQERAVEQERPATQEQPVEQERPVTREQPVEPPRQAEHRSIDLAELVRYHDTLKVMMDGLLDEYSRLLSPTPASPPPPIAPGRRPDE